MVRFGLPGYITTAASTMSSTRASTFQRGINP